LKNLIANWIFLFSFSSFSSFSGSNGNSGIVKSTSKSTKMINGKKFVTTK
jgi:hypothetical protein